VTAFSASFRKLFVGRNDVYAIGFPDPKKENKLRYRQVKEPLTDAVLDMHFRGEEYVGLYQLLDDSTVGWFCVDFDAPRNADGSLPENPFPASWDDACRQAEELERRGLFVHLERSRSGNGVHLWGFLETPVLAETVRTALRPLMLRDETFDRLYPLQDVRTVSKPYGNLIALPFNGPAVQQGNAVFLSQGGIPIPPKTWIQNVTTNPSEVLVHLARKAPKARRLVLTPAGKVSSVHAASALNYENQIPGALKLISQYGCRFMQHCWQERRSLPEPMWYDMVQVCTHMRHGLDFAHLMSYDHPGYDEGTVDAKFAQALENERIGCRYIRENFPELACENCDKAPHNKAKLSLTQLVSAARPPMERIGSFESDVERVKKYNAGELQAGIPWPIDGLSDYVRFRPKEVTVVGGPPSLGKTYLMIDAGYRLAKEGVPVFIFSAETGRESLRNRILARAAQVDSAALRGERLTGRITDLEMRQAQHAAKELETLPIWTDFVSLTADDVLLQVEDALLTNRIPLDTPYVIWFDFLQFGATMTTAQESEYTRLSTLSSDFKLVAKTLDRPIVVFSQLQRDKEGNDQPQINWFKGTGRIETDMDVGIIITGERVSGERAPRTLTIVKQREGMANIALNYTLRQQYGVWDYVDKVATDVEGPLFDARAESPLEV